MKFGQLIIKVFQFKNPREDNNFLYRVFLPIDYKIDDESIDHYFIDKIELNEENIKNQIFIKNLNINEEEYKMSYHDKYYRLFIINNWSLKKELKSENYIIDYFNRRDIGNGYFIITMYDTSLFTPYASIKISENPYTCISLKSLLD